MNWTMYDMFNVLVASATWRPPPWGGPSPSLPSSRSSSSNRFGRSSSSPSLSASSSSYWSPISGLPSLSAMEFTPSIVPFILSYSVFKGNVTGDKSSTLSVMWGFCSIIGTPSQSNARLTFLKSVRFHTSIFLDHFCPASTTYPAKTPINPFGSNFVLCSLFLPSLGLNATFAPKGIAGPLNFSLCIFCHAEPSSSSSMFSRCDTHDTA